MYIHNPDNGADISFETSKGTITLAVGETKEFAQEDADDLLKRFGFLEEGEAPKKKTRKKIVKKSSKKKSKK